MENSELPIKFEFKQEFDSIATLEDTIQRYGIQEKKIFVKGGNTRKLKKGGKQDSDRFAELQKKFVYKTVDFKCTFGRKRKSESTGARKVRLVFGGETKSKILHVQTDEILLKFNCIHVYLVQKCKKIKIARAGYIFNEFLIFLQFINTFKFFFFNFLKFTHNLYFSTIKKDCPAFILLEFDQEKEKLVLVDMILEHRYHENSKVSNTKM